MDNNVNTVINNNGQIISGGLFLTTGGIAVNRIAMWNGTNWNAFSMGMNNEVQSLAIYNTPPYAGGNFITAGGTTVKRVSRWGLLTGIEPVNNTVHGSYALSQNYLNPFNPATMVKFAIPTAGLTTL
jgi:hypothetical protein